MPSPHPENVVIFHGTFGFPASNWYSSVMKALRKQGIAALTPHLPTPEGQTFATWARILDAYRDSGLLDESTILVGHSSSASFLPRYLSDRQQSVRALIAVSGFCTVTLGLPDYDVINAEISCDPINTDFGAVAELAPIRVCYLSNNDPYVPTPELEKFAALLDGTTVNLPDAGHFNVDSGYDTFPDLVERIMEISER